MKMPKSNFLKTVLYLLVVGGLLLISSFIIMFIWNNLISSFNVLPITYLEAMGINAILYVLVYSVSYGYFGAQSNLNFSKPSEEMVDQLSKLDKEELKKTLKKTIGES